MGMGQCLWLLVMVIIMVMVIGMVVVMVIVTLMIKDMVIIIVSLSLLLWLSLWLSLSLSLLLFILARALVLTRPFNCYQVTNRDRRPTRVVMWQHLNAILLAASNTSLKYEIGISLADHRPQTLHAVFYVFR